jgi:uncharacterized DUF497 family protein
MQFEWDAAKAAVNLAKHGVDFARATLVFADPSRLTAIDTRHTAEQRENTIGRVADTLLLIVTHTDRAGVTRLISARPASRHERELYHAPR